MTQYVALGGGTQCREQALELLKRGWPAGDDPRYDPDHALMLCRMMAFRPGLTFLYEHLRLFREVLQACNIFDPPSLVDAQRLCICNQLSQSQRLLAMVTGHLCTSTSQC